MSSVREILRAMALEKVNSIFACANRFPPPSYAALRDALAESKTPLELLSNYCLLDDITDLYLLMKDPMQAHDKLDQRVWIETGASDTHYSRRLQVVCNMLGLETQHMGYATMVSGFKHFAPCLEMNRKLAVEPVADKDMAALYCARRKPYLEYAVDEVKSIRQDRIDTAMEERLNAIRSEMPAGLWERLSHDICIYRDVASNQVREADRDERRAILPRLTPADVGISR